MSHKSCSKNKLNLEIQQKRLFIFALFSGGIKNSCHIPWPLRRAMPRAGGTGRFAEIMPVNKPWISRKMTKTVFCMYFTVYLRLIYGLFTYRGRFLRFLGIISANIAPGGGPRHSSVSKVFAKFVKTLVFPTEESDELTSIIFGICETLQRFFGTFPSFFEKMKTRENKKWKS